MLGGASWSVVRGDCLDWLRLLPDCSIDSVVTDPPAGIGMMGKAWDTFSRTSNYQEYAGAHFAKPTPRIGAHKGNLREHMRARSSFVSFMTDVFREVLRVLKPGGYAFVWSIPKTSHWTAWALEDAGFELDGATFHAHAKGFPKSRTLSNGGRTALKPAIEPWVLAHKPRQGTYEENLARWGVGYLRVDECRVPRSGDLTRVLGKTTVSPSGWASAKRSVVAGSANGGWPADFVLSHADECVQVGTLSLKGDGRVQTCKHLRRGEPCRGHGHENSQRGPTYHRGERPGGFYATGSGKGSEKPNGKLYGDEVAPLMACVPGCPVRALDEQGGYRRSGTLEKAHSSPSTSNTYGKWAKRSLTTFGDSGFVSRYFNVFYKTKPSRKEKEAGLEDFPAWSAGEATEREDGTEGLKNARAGAGRTGGARNVHATVKGIDFCRHLVRLVTPAGGVVLDPFCGSGSIGCAAVLEGLRYVGFELDEEGKNFVGIARARIRHWERSR